MSRYPLKSIFQRTGRLSQLTRPAFYSSSSEGDTDVSFYDMVIVGGGIVGSALACCIGQEPALRGNSVLVLESSASKAPPTHPEDTYSNRVCAVSQGSAKLLRSIGVWSAIQNTRAHSFQRMHVWDACSPAYISFTAQSSDLNFSDQQIASLGLDGSNDLLMTSNDVMGHIVENNVILHTLSNQLEKCDSIDVKRGVAIDDITVTSEGPTPSPWVGISLADGSKITTRLLVGADGSNSRVRKMMGFTEVSWSYSQSAVVATLHLDDLKNNSVAWQRFLPSGPIALLPLSDAVSSLVWSTTPTHAKQLLEMPPEEFVDAINCALFDDHPQDVMVSYVNQLLKNFLTAAAPGSMPVRQLPPSVRKVAAQSRGVFPLSLIHSPNYVKPRVVLIGDAAHRVHPLAGLGVNLGFGDVLSLNQLLVEANSRGEEWGTLSLLQQYETLRQRHNIPVMATIEGLQRIFSTSWLPAVLLRSVGLQLVGAFPPIKDFISSQAQRVR